MTKKDAGGEPPFRPGRAGAKKADWIGRQLQQVYDDALGEEIPADMLALLGKLDEPPAEEEEGR